MINNYEYDRLTDEMVVVPNEQNPNYYYIKNKLDETDAIVIGNINYKEDNFYATFKNYADFNCTDLKAIAEYMDGLEKVEGDFPEIKEPAEAPVNGGMDLGALAGMFGGGMPMGEPEETIEGEEAQSAAAADTIEAEYEEVENDNSN